MRSRAYDALDTLGPGAGGLPADAPPARSPTGCWASRSPDEAVATRAFVDGSTAGRAWAHGVARELEPLAGDRLPELPAEGAVTDTPDAGRRAGPRPPPSPPPPPPRRASRAAAARCSSAACSRHRGRRRARHRPHRRRRQQEAASTATQAANTTSTAAQPQVRAQINLTPPKDAPAKKALAIVQIVDVSGQTAHQRRLAGPADLQQEGRLRDLGLHSPSQAKLVGGFDKKDDKGHLVLPGRSCPRT